MEIGELSAREFFSGLDTEVEAHAEDGSKKVWLSVTGLAAALIFYGDIRQSVDYLVRDGRRVGDFFIHALSQKHQVTVNNVIRRERRVPVTGRLRRLFERVRNGSLTPDQATGRALQLLLEAGVDPSTVADLSNRLSTEFTTIGVSGTPDSPDRELPKRERVHIGETPHPSRGTRGVIVWRDRKTGKVELRTY